MRKIRICALMTAVFLFVGTLVEAQSNKAFLVHHLSSAFEKSDSVDGIRCYSVLMQNNSKSVLNVSVRVIGLNTNKSIEPKFERIYSDGEDCGKGNRSNSIEILPEHVVAYNLILENRVLSEIEEKNKKIALIVGADDSVEAYFDDAKLIASPIVYDYRRQVGLINNFTIIFAFLVTIVAWILSTVKSGSLFGQIKLQKIDFKSDWLLVSAVISGLAPALTNFVSKQEVLKSIAEINGAAYSVGIALIVAIYLFLYQILSENGKDHMPKWLFLMFAFFAQIGIFGSIANLCLYFINAPDFGTYGLPYVPKVFVLMLIVMAAFTILIVLIKTYQLLANTKIQEKEE